MVSPNASAIVSEGRGTWDLTPPVREPSYQTDPRYALLVFGLYRQRRIWMALDGTTLYVDRDADGDLTEDGEKLEPAGITRFGNAGSHTHMDNFEFTVVGGTTGKCKLRLQHWVRADSYTPQTDFEKKVHAQWLELRHENCTLWRLDGKGRGQTPVIFMRRPADAHVCALDGPLTFVLKEAQSPGLKHGEAGCDLAFQIVVIGRPYSGAEQQFYNPLTTSEVPERAHLEVAIEFPAKLADAPPLRQNFLLKQRC